MKQVIDGSRSIATVARENGVGEGTLGNWVAAYRREHAGEEPPLTVNERERLQQLEREARETLDGERVPEKAALSSSHGIIGERCATPSSVLVVQATYPLPRGRQG